MLLPRPRDKDCLPSAMGVDEQTDEWAVNEASGGVASALLARCFWPIRAVEARSFRKAVARICSGTLGP